MITNKRQTGLSLIELMVSMAIGLFLIAGMLQLYTSNKASFRLQKASSEVQRNGQFALDIISNKINVAGYTGFFGDMSSGVENILKSPTNPIWDISKPIIGIDNVKDKAKVAGIKGVLKGTDVLLLKGMKEITTLKSQASNKLLITESNPDLKKGDIMLITDIDQASLFQADKVVTTKIETKITIVNGTSPGNSKTLENAYSPDAEIGKLTMQMYYVKKGSNKSPALYEAILENTGSKIVLKEYELAKNVQDLQLTYGVDLNNDKIIDEYREGSAVADWSNVLSIGVALLVFSSDRIDSADKSSYQYSSKEFTYKKIDKPLKTATKSLKRTFRTFTTLRNRVL